MPTNVAAAAMNGITPSVTMFWIAGASWWMRYVVSAVPRVS